MSTLLSCVNITCGYHSNPHLLENLSLTVNEGDFLGLIGPNGAGKSTVFKALSGFLKPSLGKVSFREHDISSVKPAQRARMMAVLPQNIFSPLPYTVAQIVEMGRASRIPKLSLPDKRDKEVVIDSMEKMDITDYADKFFNELSGGEKQRVMLAMALAQEPELLLLDEPTSQLDIGHASHLMTLLNELNESKKFSIMIISHDIQLAAHFCKRIMIIKEGKIIADGPTKEVITPELITEAYNYPVSVHHQDDRILVYPTT